VLQQQAAPKLDFDNPNTPDNSYLGFLGMRKDIFDNLFSYILHELRFSVNRSPRNALAIFLAFLRAGISQEQLAIIFGLSQQRVSDVIDSVSLALENNFVPKFLGYFHMTKDEFVRRHNTTMASILTRNSLKKINRYSRWDVLIATLQY